MRCLTSVIDIWADRPAVVAAAFVVRRFDRLWNDNFEYAHKYIGNGKYLLFTAIVD